jgi:hypothetical protein
MGEDLVLSRNSIILRLFEQNFVQVDGPRFDDPNEIRYHVWDRCMSDRRMPGVRIGFQRQFLTERSSDFAPFTLEALRTAKGILRVRSGSMQSLGAIGVSDEGVLVRDDSSG